jgi:NAD-dependent deacetylase
MNIVAFTGAGISRESGLRTFRDAADGLWEGHDINEVANIRGWWANPQKVLDFYNMRRREVRAAEPNDGHLALAELEKDHRVTVITQNIDDLHERAGSSKVIHLHGEILKVRPFGEDDTRTIDWIEDVKLGDVDPSTGAQLRPHVVWFGEGLPELDRALKIALSPSVDALIVVGTTLNVYPAAYIATETRAWRVFLVDPHPPDLSVANLKIFAEAASTGVRRVLRDLESA